MSKQRCPPQLIDIITNPERTPKEFNEVLNRFNINGRIIFNKTDAKTTYSKRPIDMNENEETLIPILVVACERDDILTEILKNPNLQINAHDNFGKCMFYQSCITEDHKCFSLLIRDKRLRGHLDEGIVGTHGEYYIPPLIGAINKGRHFQVFNLLAAKCLKEENFDYTAKINLDNSTHPVASCIKKHVESQDSL